MLFENDDHFTWLGVAEFLADEAFNGFWIFAEVPNGGLQVRLALFLGLDFGFEGKDFLAEAFVQIKDREVPEEDTKQAGGYDQDDDELRQPVPDPKIDLFTQ